MDLILKFLNEYADDISNIIFLILSLNILFYFSSWLKTKRTGVIVMFLLTLSMTMLILRFTLRGFGLDMAADGSWFFFLSRGLMIASLVYINYIVINGRFTKVIKRNIKHDKICNKLKTKPK